MIYGELVSKCLKMVYPKLVYLFVLRMKKEQLLFISFDHCFRTISLKDHREFSFLDYNNDDYDNDNDADDDHDDAAVYNDDDDDNVHHHHNHHGDQCDLIKYPLSFFVNKETPKISSAISSF